MSKFIKVVGDKGDINYINLNNIICIRFKDIEKHIVIDLGGDGFFELTKNGLEEYNKIKNEILSKLELN